MNPERKEGKKYTDVSIAILEQNGRFWVAKLAPEDRYAGKWEFPGGKRESGETYEDAVLREVREELGIEAEIIKALPVIDYEFRGENTQLFRLYGFLCKVGKGSLKMHKEHVEHRWVTLEELKELDILESDRLSFL